MSLSQEDEAFCAALHPSLRYPHTHVYFCGRVFKVGQTNNLKERTFVVATNGIFLSKKKNFGQVKICAKMSMLDISSISIAGMQCSFSSQNVQIRIKSESVEKIAFVVYFIRQAQFPPRLLPISLHIPQDNNFNIRPATNFYKSRYLFADRITSCAFHCDVGIESEELNHFYEHESLPFKLFKINTHLFSLNLFRPLMLSLTFEQDLLTLSFEGIKISTVLCSCQSIFLINSFLQHVVFVNCDFSGADKAFNKVFDKSNFLQPELCFKKCNCTSQDFLSFFEAVSNNSKKITTLRFINCKLDASSLVQVFQNIFFNECYHSLATLEINSIGEIQELSLMIGSLAGCSWALTSKCVKLLLISGCGNIDCSKMLSNIFGFNIGVRQIHMTNNKFVQKVEYTDSSEKRELDFLNLSNSSFTKEAFSSIIKILASNKVMIYGLDISSMKVDSSEEMTEFLSCLANDEYSFPNLEAFYFDNNVIDSQQTLLLAKFLSKLKNIKRLSLCCSATIRVTASGFTELCSVIGELKLQSFYLRGNESMDFSYGKLILPMLRKLLAAKTTETLDVSNQGFGSECIELLENFAEAGIKELRFDGCNSPSFDSIISFCHMIISTPLRYASWPKKEFDKHISLPSLNTDKATLIAEADMLHSTFTERFGTYCDETDYVLKELHAQKYTNMRETTRDKENQTANTGIEESEANEEVKDKFASFGITKRSDEITKLLSECITSVKMEKDPALELLCSLEQSLSLQQLLSKANEINQRN